MPETLFLIKQTPVKNIWFTRSCWILRKLTQSDENLPNAVYPTIEWKTYLKGWLIFWRCNVPRLHFRGTDSRGDADRVDESRSYRESYVVRVIKKKTRWKGAPGETGLANEGRSTGRDSDFPPARSLARVLASRIICISVSLSFYVPRGDELSSPRIA